jgi:hypothetical protein
MKSKLWIATRGIAFNKDTRYSFSPGVADLLYKVSDRTTIRRNYDLMDEAFSSLLGNLYVADVMDEPLIYSRDANGYTIERERYGYQWYTYGMMVRLVDAMYALGLIEGVKGRQVANGQLKPSKMWASDDLMDFLRTVNGHGFTKRSGEVLFLKDADKHLCDYPESTKTRRMRRQLLELNEMLSSLRITFHFNYAQLSDRAKPRVAKLMKLRSMLLTNQILIEPLHTVLVTDYERENYLQTDSNTTKYYGLFDHDAFLQSILNGLEFNCSISQDANFMRRIFNVDWFHGGRFYQAPHITMPSTCRKAVVINGEPSMELDYSGLHIRMLYNRIGIDYRGECYVFEKADSANKTDRDRIKIASLILINSKDRGKAIKAIHNECRKKGIQYPPGEHGRYSELVDKFERYHEPIRQFFLSGKGLELQFQDSTIMANILSRMTKENIPALPVHDSVICPARHEGFLHQLMVEEYEKVMGFEPVIG